MSVDHYENFPVASILCPPALRPAVVALYHYARTADDLADEGVVSPHDRRQAMARYRAALARALADEPSAAGEWPQVFEPLRHAIRRHALPPKALFDLLDAFEQDVDNPPYDNRAALLDYCRRSANPVGRLLLHLYGVDDPVSLERADDICTALQLINFWQDCSRDHPQGRCYIPHDDARQHGLQPELLTQLQDSPTTQAMLADLVVWARQTMHRGLPLALTLPGRAGWELRLVVLGGLRILEKIESMNYRTLGQRPRLRAWDVPLLLWRALRFSHNLPPTAQPAPPPSRGTGLNT